MWFTRTSFNVFSFEFNVEKLASGSGNPKDCQANQRCTDHCVRQFVATGYRSPPRWNLDRAFRQCGQPCKSDRKDADGCASASISGNDNRQFDGVGIPQGAFVTGRCFSPGKAQRQGIRKDQTPKPGSDQKSVRSVPLCVGQVRGTARTHRSGLVLLTIFAFRKTLTGAFLLSQPISTNPSNSP